MSSPTFSVVIPTYNQADFLALALESVLSQGFQDFEIIVIDNFSTDHTTDVVNKVRGRRVQLIHFHNNGIIGASRNRGILMSNAEHIAFLDSDDLWHPQKLEKVMEVFAGNPRIDVVWHNVYRFGDGKGVRRTKGRIPTRFEEHIYEYLLFWGNVLSASGTVVRRGKLLEVGLFSEDPAFVTVEDYELWLKLAKVARFHFIPEILGKYRIHKGSASANNERHLNGTLNLLRASFSCIDVEADSSVQGRVRKRYAQAYYGAARGCCETGDFGESLQYYKKAVQTHPFFWKTYFVSGLLVLRFAQKFVRRWMCVLPKIPRDKQRKK